MKNLSNVQLDKGHLVSTFWLLSISVAALVAVPFSLLVLLIACVFARQIDLLLLILWVSFIQSLKGFHLPWNYLGLLLLLLFYIIRFGCAEKFSRSSLYLVAALAFMPLYGFICGLLSLNHEATIDIVIQAFVAAFLPFAALLLVQDIASQKASLGVGVKVVQGLMCLLVVYQISTNPLVAMGAEQSARLVEKAQIVGGEDTIARAIGAFSNPNALAFFAILAFSLLLWFEERVSPWNVLATLFLVGLSLSKSSLIVLLIVLAFWAFFLVHGVWKLGLLLLVLPIAVAMILLWGDGILNALRVSDLELLVESSRGKIYFHMMSDFPAINFFFGFGQFSWEPYFSDQINLDVQDPHSWIFSIPGAYGVMGLVTYLVIIWRLGTGVLKKFYSVAALVPLTLFLIVAFRDLFAIPTVFGTTLFTFVFFIIYFGVEQEARRA